jgi:hypothetical protein
MTSIAVLVSANGMRLVKHSNAITPKAYRSTAGVISAVDVACSGAMYTGVPTPRMPSAATPKSET